MYDRFMKIPTDIYDWWFYNAKAALRICIRSTRFIGWILYCPDLLLLWQLISVRCTSTTADEKQTIQSNDFNSLL